MKLYDRATTRQRQALARAATRYGQMLGMRCAVES